MRKSYQGKHLRRLAAAVCAALVAGAAGFAPVLYANPVLDSKDGAVSISGLNTANVSITSEAANNVIKWVDFSIGSGEKVTFDTHNYLNYVTGHARSDILGTLTGGGSIYLVNPNGILIGDGATINVGNLYLSTRNLSEDVLNAFSTKGTDPLTTGNIGGDVINLGTLNADSVTVEGNNITFKNVADVNSGSAANVTLTAKGTGEIRIGSATGGDLPAYTMSGTDKKYMYKLVNNATDLQNMSTDLAVNYMLAKNIDMSGVGDFTPIGFSGGFTGRFDGLNYQIQNLTFESDKYYVGLFGINKGVIENVGLVGGSVTGKTSGSVGGLVGFNLGGTIRNVYNTGSVTGEGTASGSNYVGGIVAYNQGTVERAYNTGTVTGAAGNGTGGIVGENESVVSQVFNTGNVSAEGKDYVGGVVGQNAGGNISDAYNTGAVSGKNIIGGIVGCNSTNGTVTNVYNTGTATGTQYVGGIVGANYGTIRNAYSQDGTAAAVCGARGSNATENDVAIKSETDMKQKATFAGFDFTENGAWRIYGDNTMPLLTAFLTRKDNITNTTIEYNGTATGDVGARYAATTYNGVQAQIGGANYISDVSKVTPRDLTVSFGASPDKTYDGTTSATAGTATLTGKVEGDDVSLATGVTANYEDKNAGTNKQVNYTNVALTGDAAKNYNLTNAATVTGTGDITAKAITASFADISKTYDGTTNATAGTATLTGVITGDTVNVSGTAAFADRNAGTNKTVNYTGVTLSGTDAGNYTLASTTATGTRTIDKANLTITSDPVTKTYDGTTDAMGVANIASGTLYDGDIISGGTFTFTDKNAGTNKTVTVSDVTIHDGNHGGNYNVTYAANTASTINQKEAQVTFDPTTKTYDGTTSATPGKATFWYLVDADKGKVGVTADVAYEDKNVGTGKRVKYTNITLTGAEAQNYRLAQTYLNADNGTITRKALELVATPQTITESEATPTEWSGSVTGFVAGEGLDANDTLSFALDNPAAAAVGSYKVTGTLSIDGAAPLTSGDYGTNYTFANAATNATAFTIAAKYVPPTPTPSAPSGGNGGNTSGTGANTPAPLAAAEPVIVATVTETETIAAAATAGATAEMSHIADNVSPTSLTEQPANSDENAAAAPLAAAGETAANAQGFTLTAGGLLAISNETNSAPKDAMSPESIGHTLSVLQRGSGEEQAPGETGGAKGLEEAIETADLAIGTEIVETDREGEAADEDKEARKKAEQG